MGNPNKKEKFGNKRIEIISKLNTILGISAGNISFSSKELDSKKDEILNLLDDIKGAFNYSTWNYFKSEQEIVSLVKSVYQEMGYELERNDVKVNKVRKYAYTLKHPDNPKGYLFRD